MEKNIENRQIWTPLDPLCPQFWGGSSADSPLKIRDEITTYLETLFQQKTENL